MGGTARRMAAAWRQGLSEAPPCARGRAVETWCPRAHSHFARKSAWMLAFGQFGFASYPQSSPAAEYVSAVLVQTIAAACRASARLAVTAICTRDPTSLIVAMSRSTLLVERLDDPCREDRPQLTYAGIRDIEVPLDVPAPAAVMSRAAKRIGRCARVPQPNVGGARRGGRPAYRTPRPRPTSRACPAARPRRTSPRRRHCSTQGTISQAESDELKAKVLG